MKGMDDFLIEDLYASIILALVVNTPVQLTLILLKIFTQVAVPWPWIFFPSICVAIAFLSVLCIDIFILLADKLDDWRYDRKK